MPNSITPCTILPFIYIKQCWGIKHLNRTTVQNRYNYKNRITETLISEKNQLQQELTVIFWTESGCISFRLIGYLIHLVCSHSLSLVLVSPIWPPLAYGPRRMPQSARSCPASWLRKCFQEQGLLLRCGREYYTPRNSKRLT